MSEFVGVSREAEGVKGERGRQAEAGSRAAYRSRSREPPTQAASRGTNTLTLPGSRAALRYSRVAVRDVRESREHGTEAVQEDQESDDLWLWREVEYQDTLQCRRCFAGLTTRTTEAAKSVRPLAAGGFRDAQVGAEKRAAKLVL